MCKIKTDQERYFDQCNNQLTCKHILYTIVVFDVICSEKNVLSKSITSLQTELAASKEKYEETQRQHSQMSHDVCIRESHDVCTNVT